MKKILTLLLIFSLVSICTVGCSYKQANKKNMIQSKRRFANYVESTNKGASNSIDLSDGQKLKYEADLGPKNLNFDIKIIDPY